MRSAGILAALLPSLAFALSSNEPRAVTDGPIGPLYAYGTKVNGQPVFFNDGVAYLGKASLVSNSSSVAAVNFTISDTTLTAGPAATTSNTSTIGNPTLYIDTSSAVSNVLLASSAPSGSYTSTGFTLYVGMLALKQDARLVTSWSVADSATDGIYVLQWGSSSAEHDSQVVLRPVAPAS